MLWLIVLTLLVSSYGTPRNYLHGRIIGGESTNIEKYPYQVAIEFFDILLCGGTILSPIYVITTVQCIRKISVETLTVRAGSNTTASGGQELKVQEIFQNPLFSITTFDYDISILFLSSPIEFGPAAMPIKLVPKNFELKTGKLVTVTGWGTPVEGGEFAKILQMVEVPLISQEECNYAYEDYTPITPRMICTQQKGGGKAPCLGDFGGPMVVDNLLAGVVSWSISCAQFDYPSVYIKISEVRDFIKNVTQI